MAPFFPERLYALDEEQTRAVEDRSDHVFIKGEPGTGVTQVIIRRILDLIANGVPPSTILCLTGSVQQAEKIISHFEALKSHSWIEMDAAGQRAYVIAGSIEGLRLLWEERYRNAEAALRVPVMSVEQYILDYERRNEGRLTGISRESSLWNHHRMMQCLSRIAAHGVLGEQPSSMDISEVLLSYRRKLERADSFILEPIAERGLLSWSKPVPSSYPVWDELMRLYETERVCQCAIAVDELVRKASDAQTEKELWLDYAGETAAHVLIDGAQDMPHAALAFIVILQADSLSLTVGGNINCGVSGWRGIDSQRMLRFQGRGYAYSTHHLPTQHGCTGNLSVFNHRLATELEMNPSFAPASPVTSFEADLIVCDDHRQMIEHLTESFHLNHRRGYGVSQFAWLFRNSATMMEARRALLEDGMRHALLGQSPVPWHEDAPRVIALLSSVLNPHDIEAFRAIAGTLVDGKWQPLNGWTVAEILNIGRRDGLNFVEAARHHAGLLDRRGPIRKALTRTLRARDDLKEALQGAVGPTSLRDWCEAAHRSLNDQRHADTVYSHDLRRLLSIADTFVNWNSEESESVLRRFVDHIELGGNSLARPGEITLGTVYSARGLRWDHVCVVEAGQRLNNQGAAGSGPGNQHLPDWEERQILFSAATRSAESLTFLTLPGSDLERIWPRLVPVQLRDQ